MKTITEYRPMIFSRLATQAVQRREARQQFMKSAGMITAHSSGAIGLMIDTGCLPRTWPFWAKFAPLFVAGELAAYVLRPR